MGGIVAAMNRLVVALCLYLVTLVTLAAPSLAAPQPKVVSTAPCAAVNAAVIHAGVADLEGVLIARPMFEMNYEEHGTTPGSPRIASRDQGFFEGVTLPRAGASNGTCGTDSTSASSSCHCCFVGSGFTSVCFSTGAIPEFFIASFIEPAMGHRTLFLRERPGY